jgi:hypothetical protein
MGLAAIATPPINGAELLERANELKDALSNAQANMQASKTVFDERRAEYSAFMERYGRVIQTIKEA